MSTSPARTLPLSVPRATALYIGALLGPGLLLLPGLAAEQAGPASIIAWVALLGLSAILAKVFTGLGQAVPGAAGAAGYAPADPRPPAPALPRGGPQPPGRGHNPLVVPGRRHRRGAHRLPDRGRLRDRPDRRRPAAARRRRRRAAARGARPGGRRGPGQRAGPAAAGRAADR